MKILDRWLKRADTTKSEYEEELRNETAKVRAFRMAEEVSAASKHLMEKALELRAEIEAMADD